MRSLVVMWTILAGLIAFGIWLQIWTPIYNDIVYPYITNAENNIAYSDLIVTLLAFAPLFVVFVILLMPIMSPEPERLFD
ncbi:MAG: hypothetical protein DRP11_02930 [Candidatus Aenigmatarchaeota archaeon]|nr:MAG: hypothetical protein DRP11_02930 [Candidatus Aenigmarchaeota archaeon]